CDGVWAAVTSISWSPTSKESSYLPALRGSSALTYAIWRPSGLQVNCCTPRGALVMRCVSPPPMGMTKTCACSSLPEPAVARKARRPSRARTRTQSSWRLLLPLHRAAALHDEADALQLGDVLQRIAGHRDEVGEPPGLEGAEVALPSQQLRAHARRGLDGLQ